MPLIFGACIELHLLFGTFDVLYCKTPLIFNACVELRLSFGTSNVLHCKNLLYLALVFNLVFHSALPMCCIAKKLVFGACVELHLSFRTADELHCKKNSCIWRLC